MPDRVAVGAEGAGRGIQLLDPAVPQVAAVVDHVVAHQLVDPQLHAEWVPLGGQPAPLEGAEDTVRVRLEEREGPVGALLHRTALVPVLVRPIGSHAVEQRAQTLELGIRGLGATPRAASRSSAARRTPLPDSGAPTPSTTSLSARSSADTCSAVPGSKNSALRRIGGSAARTSSSTASWRAPWRGITPQ